jgi:type IX secretion system PorP/SprF family membrane protein
MRKALLHIALVFLSAAVQAQDMMWLNPKATNYALRNPANSGLKGGLLQTSFSQSQYNAGGKPLLSQVNAQLPILDYIGGVSLNATIEEINVLRTTTLQTGFGYHMDKGRGQTFSLGLGIEASHTGLNDAALLVRDASDQVISQYRNANWVMDYSFGFQYRGPLFHAGAAVNRIATWLLLTDTERVMPAEFIVQTGLYFPLANGRALLEPVVNYRRTNYEEQQFEGGVYFHFNDQFRAGGRFRTDQTMSVLVAAKPIPDLEVAYTYELQQSNTGVNIGNIQGISLRYTFNPRPQRDEAIDFIRNRPSMREMKREGIEETNATRISGKTSKPKNSKIDFEQTKKAKNRRWFNFNSFKKLKRNKIRLPKKKRRKFRRKKR